MNIPNWFVCVMGMGVTFFGLICLILLSMVMSKLCNAKKTATPAAAPAPVPAPLADAIPNRQELIAAVSVALAEELGEDVSAIRILSFKNVS